MASVSSTSTPKGSNKTAAKQNDSKTNVKQETPAPAATKETKSEVIHVTLDIFEDKNREVFKLRAKAEGRAGQPRILAEGPNIQSLEEYRDQRLLVRDDVKANEAILLDKDKIEKISLMPKGPDGRRNRTKNFDDVIGQFGITSEMLARIEVYAKEHDLTKAEVIRMALDAYLPEQTQATGATPLPGIETLSPELQAAAQAIHTAVSASIVEAVKAMQLSK